MLFPTILTYFYFVLFAGGSGGLPKMIYSFGKVIQFLLPMFWLYFVGRVSILSRSKFCVDEVVIRGGDQKKLLVCGDLFWYYFFEGIIFGVLVFFGILFLYLFWFGVVGGELGVGSRAVDVIRQKVDGFGLVDWRLFLVLGIFYVVIHSGLEEYFWRWFIFGGLCEYFGWCVCLVISGFGFGLHHVLLLGTFFGFGSMLCWLGAFGVMVGGMYWAWLYQRSNSLLSAWLGHGIIDAAIFLVGYLICFT
jgi:membrane protease YdiL (CAAX protease family)